MTVPAVHDLEARLMQQQQARMMKVIALASQARNANDLVSFLDSALDLVIAALDPERAMVLAQKPQTQKLVPLGLRLQADLPPEGRRVMPHVPSVARALNEKKPVLDNDVPAPAGQELAVRSCACVPLVLGAPGAGVLCVDCVTQYPTEFCDQDLEFLGVVAVQVAYAIGRFGVQQ
jgi:transcriptional regulator with GAF, ATPase, and Fis domain